MLENLKLPNLTPKTWALILSSFSLAYLVLHYNLVKRRNKMAPIDFVVDKCVEENSSQAPKKIVLIHGWPDNPSLWKYQIPELTKKYDCYRIILPNYDKKAKNYEGAHSWGYDLVELAHSVNHCVRTRIRSHADEKVTLLIHDWGSYVGYLAYKFDQQNMYERIVSIDVGDHTGIDGIWSGFNVILYQWFNAAMFLMPRPLGDLLNYLFPIIARAPLVREKRMNEIHAGMNYLYFYLWWRILTQQLQDVGIKRGDIFKVPFLFIYGDKSPFKFHSQAFAKKMQQAPNAYVLLKGHTHWAMYDKKGQEFNKVALDWLDRTENLSSTTTTTTSKEDNDAKL